MKVRKKPVVVEAMQFEGDNINEIARFCGDELAGQYVVEGEFYEIETLEGEMIVRPGDWIIRGVAGEVYPCRDDIFRQTYEVETE